MAIRAYWTGTLNVLGIVELPIALYSAVDKKGIEMNRMSPCCHSKTEQKITCAKCSKEIPYGDLLKGFEDGNEFKEIRKEDIDRIKLPTTDTIRIEGFLSPSVVYSSTFETEKRYYVGVDEEKHKKTKEIIPNTEGRKTYELLAKALTKTGKIAVGKVAMRGGKEEIVSIKAHKNGLVFTALYFPEAVRDTTEVYKYGDTTIDKEEQDLTEQLINSMGAVDLNAMKDKYSEALVELIATGNTPKVEIVQAVDTSKALKDKLRMAVMAAGQ